jgi:uncharacterized protein (TIGR03067 family)
MMSITRTVLTLLCVLAISLIASAATGLPKDLKELQGTWSVTTIEKGGERPPKGLQKLKVTFTTERMIMEASAPDEKPEKAFKREFTFKIDSSKTPKSIDLVPLEEPNKGEVIEGIYQLDGDELKVCIPNQKMESRPTELKSPKGSPLVLMSLKRSKQ